VLGVATKACESTFTSRDTILYALGLGFSKDPYEEKDLKYTYELKDDFAVFPTFGTVAHKSDIL